MARINPDLMNSYGHTFADEGYYNLKDLEQEVDNMVDRAGYEIDSADKLKRLKRIIRKLTRLYEDKDEELNG